MCCARLAARSRTILGIFLMEGVLQGLISWLIAIPLSLVVSPIAGSSVGKIDVWGNARLSIQLAGGGNLAGNCGGGLRSSHPLCLHAAPPVSAYATAWRMHENNH